MSRTLADARPATRLWLLLSLLACATTACDQGKASTSPAERPERAEPKVNTVASQAPAERPAAEQRPASEPKPAVTPELPAESAKAAAPAPAPASPTEPARPEPARTRPRRPVREIHPRPGETGCVEMYGSCTSGTPQVCTSSAYALDCGKRGQLPVTAEPLLCVCP